jgi:flagellar biogenesis protein FliO
VDDHLIRLLWAFPLVILLGVLLIYGLKRLGVHQEHAGEGSVAKQPELISSTDITPHTRALHVRHQGQQFLVFESSQQIHVTQMPTSVPQAQMWPLAGRTTPWRRPFKTE